MPSGHRLGIRQKVYFASEQPGLGPNLREGAGTKDVWGSRTTMQVAYLTTDEINEDLALRMAEACDVALYAFSSRDAPANGSFDAVLYDWDCLPLPWRQQVLSELLSGPSSGWVVVHSYNLDEKHVKALRHNGVAVFQRLEPEVFRSLCLYSSSRAKKRGSGRRGHALSRRPAHHEQ